MAFSIETSGTMNRSGRKRFDKLLQEQKDFKMMEENKALDSARAGAKENGIVASYFFEQYHSPRCWKTVREAKEQYNELPSESRKLEAVKEQHLIPFLGLGWLEAHHPWSRGKHTFSADELFDNLINVVIPLYNKLDPPDKPPLSMPTQPVVVKLDMT